MHADRPKYKTYRARRRPWDRFRRSQFDKLGQTRPPEPGDPDFPAPPPSSSRSDAGLSPTPPPRRARPTGAAARREPRRPPKVRAPRSARTWLKVLKWTVIWAASWVVLSAVLFAVSATIQQSRLQEGTNEVLGGGGNFVTSPGNVLMMGLDERPRHWNAVHGPARTDTLMLVRSGGGQAARLSIPRDSYAQIPGYQAQKINAAYALGGAPLTIRAVEDFMNVGGGRMKINHIVIVDFTHFPALIDGMGGVTVNVTQKCIVSTFDGKEFRLGHGKHRLSGEQALRYARVRKNVCNPSETDIERAARQQRLVQSMKSRLFHPMAFIRMPWIAWTAPKAFVTDMSPFTLAGFMASMTVGKTPKPRVLKPVAPGPAGSIVIDEQQRARWARRLGG